MPSVTEYSLCSLRWTNGGEGMADILRCMSVLFKWLMVLETAGRALLYNVSAMLQLPGC